MEESLFFKIRSVEKLIQISFIKETLKTIIPF